LGGLRGQSATKGRVKKKSQTRGKLQERPTEDKSKICEEGIQKNKWERRDRGRLLGSTTPGGEGRSSAFQGSRGERGELGKNGQTWGRRLQQREKDVHRGEKKEKTRNKERE